MSTYREGKDEYDVTVRLAEGDRASLDALASLTIPHEGSQIPLVSVAQFETGAGLGSITRIDLDPVVTIEGQAAPGFTSAEVLAATQEVLADDVEALPAGYALRYTGESEDQAESFGFLGTALALGVALIFPHPDRAVQLGRAAVPHHGGRRPEPDRRAARPHPDADGVRSDDVHRP